MYAICHSTHHVMPKPLSFKSYMHVYMYVELLLVKEAVFPPIQTGWP